MSINKDNDINNLLNSVSQKLGSSNEEVKKAAQNKDFSNLFNKMDPKDAQKIQSVLADKAATEKILASPKAQALIKKLLGDNK